MASWRACIACPLRALNILGPVAGRVLLPVGSFSRARLCVYYKPITHSRAPPSRWACPSANPCLRHAVCRECDSDLQARPSIAQRRCPICRCAREVMMLD